MVANADHHGGTAPRRDHLMRMVGMHHDQAISPPDLPEGSFDRLQQVAVILALNQMGHDFGVGFRRKLVALELQLFAQRIVIFDDAIVYHHDRAAMTGMGMGIGLRRFAMRGPTRVAHADRAGQMAIFKLGSQGGNLAFIPHPIEFLIFNDGNASGVISPVFQPLQAANQDGNCCTFANIANDAAHNAPPHAKLNK